MCRCIVVLVVVLIAIITVAFLPNSNEGPELTLITSSPGVEEELEKYEDLIGEDYYGYRGHIYRVLSYSMYFLNGDETYRTVIEKALVYHDIGLWTDNVLDYLDPSVEVAKKNLQNSFSEEEMQLIDDIIVYHHKITPFEGPHADIVNAVRKADWIDATQGLVHHGMPQKNIQKAYHFIPAAGFYETLAAFGPKLHGYNVFAMIWEIKNIYKF